MFFLLLFSPFFKNPHCTPFSSLRRWYLWELRDACLFHFGKYKKSNTFIFFFLVFDDINGRVYEWKGTCGYGMGKEDG